MSKLCLRTVTLAILVASIVFPTMVRALDFTIGVKAGDWIKYGQISIAWNGNGTKPSYITEEEKMDWGKLEVENVTGTTISVNTTNHYKNGTETSATSSFDLNSSTMSGNRFLIPANLKSGDVFPTQTMTPLINRTTTGIYAGAYRKINVFDFTTIVRSASGNQTATGKLYWDQSTGILVEMYQKAPDYINPGAYTELSFKATETNMWSPDFLGTLSNNLIYIIAGIIIIIAVIAAAIVLRRKKPTSPPQSPSAQTTETATKDTKQE